MKLSYILPIVLILAVTSIGAGMHGSAGRYQVFTAKIKTVIDVGDKPGKSMREQFSEELLKVDTETGEVWHLVAKITKTGHKREWRPLIINEPALNLPR